MDQLRAHADIQHQAMIRAYALWAPAYDALCGPFFRSGRAAAAAETARLGRDLLDIGVGTGLSLGDYDARKRIVGVDASAAMIAKARARVRRGGLDHVRALEAMDAHDLGFPDACFDVVVGQFLITLVERPECVLDEAARVLRPGGAIVLVNHFYSETGLLAAVERRLGAAARRVGLRPDFPLARIADWAAGRADMRLAVARRIEPLRWFTLVRLDKAL